MGDPHCLPFRVKVPSQVPSDIGPYLSCPGLVKVLTDTLTPRTDLDEHLLGEREERARCHRQPPLVGVVLGFVSSAAKY